MLATVDSAQRLAKQRDWLALYNCYDTPSRAAIDQKVEFVRGEYEASFSERTQRLAELPLPQLFVACCDDNSNPVRKMLLGTYDYPYANVETIDGDRAEVYQSSTCEVNVVFLTRENGEWKLSNHNPYR